MSLLLLAVLFLTLFFLQATLALPVGAAHLHPDLVLLFALSTGVVAGSGPALVWAALGGILINLLSVAPLGAYVVAFLPVTALTLLRKLHLLESSFMLTLALAFAGTFLCDCLLLLVLWSAGYRVEWLPSLFWITLPRA